MQGIHGLFVGSKLAKLFLPITRAYFLQKANEIAQLEAQIRELDMLVQKFRQKTSELYDEIVGYKDRVCLVYANSRFLSIFAVCRFK